MADNAPSPAVARFRIILWTLVIVAAVAATALYFFRPPNAPVGVTGSPFALESTRSQYDFSCTRSKSPAQPPSLR